MLWVCYCVPVTCLFDRAAMFCVCYCVPVGYLEDRQLFCGFFVLNWWVV
jgi:hypothetical protein